MPSLTNRQSIAANATIQNVFADAMHYRLRGDSRIVMYGTASAVGLNSSLYIGDELFLDDQEVSAQNRMPLVPDDFVVEAAGRRGDEIISRWRNTTAGAITGFVRIDVQPMGPQA